MARAGQAWGDHPLRFLRPCRGSPGAGLGSGAQFARGIGRASADDGLSFGDGRDCLQGSRCVGGDFGEEFGAYGGFLCLQHGDRHCAHGDAHAEFKMGRARVFGGGDWAWLFAWIAG